MIIYKDAVKDIWIFWKSREKGTQILDGSISAWKEIGTERFLMDERKKGIGLGNRKFELVFVGLCFQQAENVLLCI